jgi:type IV fimbrial biogenesis protein FimT
MAHTRGFTLIELMVTIAILAILITVAAPPLTALTMNAAMTGNTNDLMTALQLARSEAVTRGMPVVLCTSNTGTTCTNSQWQEGWIVVVDSNGDGDLDAGMTALKAQSATDSQTTITSIGHRTNAASARYVSYVASGALSSDTPLPVNFTLCDTRTVAAVGDAAALDKGRIISLSTTGRAVATRTTCP